MCEMKYIIPLIGVVVMLMDFFSCMTDTPR